MSTTETEITTLVSAVKEAEDAEASYAEATPIDDEGEADSTAASCKLCDESCAADSQKTLTTEIEKRKVVVKKKYIKMKEFNKKKKIHAHNKKVAGDSACTAAQKAKDPAEKKKQRKICKDLREESSKLTTEAEIEGANIDEQEKAEDKEISDETQQAIKDQNDKSSSNEKSNEINKAKLKEQTSTRIVKETEERIGLIKKKLETERIVSSVVTT